MNLFPAIPFFRIMLPFIAGILIAVFTGFRNPVLAVFTLPLFLTALADTSILRNKITLMAAMDLVLICLGFSLVSITDISTRPDFYGNVINTAQKNRFALMLLDQPVPKEKTYKLTVKVRSVKPEKSWRSSEGNLIVYVRKSEKAARLRPGQIIHAEGNLQPLKAPMNPDAFDYRRYLYNKQIYHTLFLDTASWLLYEEKSQLHPVVDAGIRCRGMILNTLKTSGLTAEAYAICAALLTGYDDEITQDVMLAFSHSGTLHVLSVSGLHTGLIYMVLNFMFNFLDKKNRHKIFRFIFVTLALWAFALISGFSPPVLRAVIMFNILGLGKLFFRGTYRNQLNVLLVSAFILLFVNPWLITDLGFLLSYFAMFGLIYFQPLISSLMDPVHPVTKALWTSISASVAATLSTLPLTLFLFKQFPVWFFVCNLVVVPATFLLLLLAFLIVIKLGFLAIPANYLVTWLIIFIDLFDVPGWGYIDFIHFTFGDFIAQSMVIVLIAAVLQYRSFRTAGICLILVIVWQLFSIAESWRAKNDTFLVVYENKKKSLVLLKNKTRTYLGDTDKSSFQYNVRGHFTSFSYPELDRLDSQVFEASQEVVVLLDQHHRLPSRYSRGSKTLVLLNGRQLREEEISSLPGLKRIVVDGSHARTSRHRTKDLCRKFGIEFYDVAERGAFVIPL